jgi:hypothetical protein
MYFQLTITTLLHFDLWPCQNFIMFYLSSFEARCFDWYYVNGAQQSFKPHQLCTYSDRTAAATALWESKLLLRITHNLPQILSTCIKRLLVKDIYNKQGIEYQAYTSLGLVSQTLDAILEIADVQRSPASICSPSCNNTWSCWP